MNGAFYIAATGLRAQQDALSVLAINVSNVNTTGFKRSESRFATLVGPAAPNLLGSAEQSSAAVGVETTEPLRDLRQGALRATGQAMDIAIDGEGFVELVASDGEARLWRGGALTVNDDGFLAAANGMPLKAAVAVPAGATRLTIGRDGVVSAATAGEEAVEIGKIELVVPRSAAALSPVGDGLYRIEAAEDVFSAAPGQEGAGAMLQGSIEGSNVDLAEELVALMLTQRAYAANAQVVQASDQLMSISNSLRR